MYDYFERLQRRLDGYEKGVPAILGDKAATRPFAKQIGVNTPELLFRGNADDLRGFDFPKDFVIKPKFASTSIGVFLLERVGEGQFRDLHSGKIESVDGLIAYYKALSLKHYGDDSKGEIFVEELLRDYDGAAPPPDVRAYMFQGQCGFFLVEDHIGGIAQASYFDENFEPLENLHERFGVAPQANNLEKIVERDAPPRKDEIINLAKRISIAVPTAFCRVDMYDTPKGVYLGEITFFPGTFYYKNRKIMRQVEADRLGRLWGEAELRLAGSRLNPAPKVNL